MKEEKEKRSIMMSERLKELRESKKLSQERVGRAIGTSQQNLSRYETDVNIVPIDMLIRLASYYNVATDYILGVSDVKRNPEGQRYVEKLMEENYDFVQTYKSLNEDHRDLLRDIAERLAEIEMKEKTKK